MKHNNHLARKSFIYLIGLIGSLLLASASAADSSLVYSGKNGPSRIHLSSAGLRMETAGKDGSQAIIYNGQSDEFILIMPKKKSYMVMTQKDVEAIGNIRGRMMEQMEQQLADVPPAQREQMRRMMSSMMQGKLGQTAQPLQVRYVKTGETAKALGQTCHIYELRVNGNYEGDACVAPISQLDIPQSEYSHFNQMLAFMQKMAQSAGIESGGMMAGMPKNNVPLWFEADGQRNALQSISHKSLDPSLFLPPAGYKRTSNGLDKLRP